ncbi:hypothetical protein AB4Z52_13650 [Rhizobium sp. 2YAF20]|uniref:hypothetical protein n=1 Tax=Rhizobium sp. 2YAF20 TaxID=3233027 RepID=UPI003F9842DE
MAFAQLHSDGKWEEWYRPTSSVVEAANEALSRKNVSNIFLSQQTFGRKRAIVELVALGAAYADLDYHKSQYAGQSAETVKDAVLKHLMAAKKPLPSYILSTGRGLLCVWLHELMGVNALPIWSATQRHTAKLLTAFGADQNALDAARVFRLVGSNNSKVNHSQRVHLIWSNGDASSPHRYPFGDLADSLLPHTRAEIKILRAERATRNAEGKDIVKPARQLSQATLWSTRFQDLRKLRNLRWADGAIPSGQRDAWLFIASVALTWLAPPEAMVREITALAQSAAGWSESETSARTSAAFKRATAAAAGEKVTWNGKEYDPRYRYSSARIIDMLKIEPGEMVQADLRCLCDEGRLSELARKRSKDWRVSQGQKTDHKTRADERLRLGVEAARLRGDGMSTTQLCEKFGVSRATITKAIKEASSLPS